MTERLDLPQRYRSILEALLREHVPDAEVWAYGSRITGESHEGSDLDLVVRGPGLEPLGDGFFRLLEAIEESNIPILVQAHDWARLPESFHREIERDYVVLLGPEKANSKGEWSEVVLGNVIELKRGYDLPQRNRLPGSIPLVSSSGITDYHTEAKVKGPGIVTGRYGTLGQVFYLRDDFWPLNTTLYVRDFKGNYPRFIAYLLREIDFSAYSDKAAVPGINRNHLHQATVRIPAVAKQREIAHILGTLDDKIELNRRMNETLEEMARTLFKSWFVDFDPVHAKAALNLHAASEPVAQPATIAAQGGTDCEVPSGWTVERARAYLDKMDPSIAGLFPDRFVDSELGEIPEGWEVKALGDVIKIHDYMRVPLNRGERAKRKGPYPYYGAAGVMSYVDDFLFDGIYVLTGEDGSVMDPDGRPVVQYIWGQFWVNNHAHVLRGKCGICEQHLFLLLKQMNIRPFVTGAVQPKLSQRNLKAVPIVYPGLSLCQIFSNSIGSLFTRFRGIATETRLLRKQRDQLLPKLIAGDIGNPE